jgi:hypothetical protein
VVVESTFTSIPALVRGMRWGWLPGLDAAITQRFDSLTKVAQIDAPLLIIHGTDDRLVPRAMAHALYAAARSHPKRLVELEGATHSGVSRHPEYGKAVQDFMRSAAASDEPRPRLTLRGAPAWKSEDQDDNDGLRTVARREAQK